MNSGKKFALIALKVRSSIREDLSFNLSGFPLKVLFQSPFLFDDFWKSQLGEFKSKEFSESNLFLLIEKESQQLSILDHENEILKKILDRFYQSIFFILPQIKIHQDGILLSGSISQENIDIRTVNEIKVPNNRSGIPYMNLESKHFLASSNVFQTQTFLWQDSPKGSYSRIKKGYRAYIRAMNEFDADEKFHHFVRSVEALLFLDKGEGASKFSERVSKIVNEKSRFFEIIYELRNQVEHMNDLGEYLVREGYTSQEEKDSFLLDCMVKIMRIASFCYCEILKKEENLSFFESDSKIKEFWQNSDLIKTIWNEKLSFE